MNQDRFSFNQIPFVAATAALAFGLTFAGCSSHTSPTGVNPYTDGYYQNDAPKNSNSDNGNNTELDTSDDDLSKDGEHRDGTFPPLRFNVDGTGYNDSYTVTVSTRSILKVAFLPDVQQKAAADSGFFPQYSKLAVFIQVGDHEEPTSLLNNGYFPQYPQQTSSIIDFSDDFEKKCDANDKSCRQIVEVRVQKPNYDYWCLQYGMSCPHTHVHATHPWFGTIVVETDDTDSIN